MKNTANRSSRLTESKREGEVSPIKKGIELFSKSMSKEKSIENLESSRLSRKSSKKSGIKVFSPKKEIKEEKNEDMKE